MSRTQARALVKEALQMLIGYKSGDNEAPMMELRELKDGFLFTVDEEKFLVTVERIV